ncbi:MAG: pyridoxamine 5'-phosphate oxidase [Nevskiaceae bacterium]|nr:MAG: pyridoxamine 5'-phosphate oxidase [Nevskiaceae bacterium]TBR73104.1 MAG: pyridoxamine 5'-phosphate oxidase [Nevskiaceae bacterium]
MNTSELHRQYTHNAPLEAAELAAEPMAQLQAWVDAARVAGMIEPTAMTVATVDADGQPSARVVLMRALDGGVVFYTNYLSRKGCALAANPRAAATFWWDRLERSVRVEGAVERLAPAISAVYFHSRPRGSQLASLTSRQSQPMASRASFEARMAENAARYAEGEIPCPEHWGGYRIVPARVEFWQGRDNRAHDRLVYVRAASGWRVERLQP